MFEIEEAKYHKAIKIYMNRFLLLLSSLSFLVMVLMLLFGPTRSESTCHINSKFWNCSKCGTWNNKYCNRKGEWHCTKCEKYMNHDDLQFE